MNRVWSFVPHILQLYSFIWKTTPLRKHKQITYWKQFIKNTFVYENHGTHVFKKTSWTAKHVKE